MDNRKKKSVSSVVQAKKKLEYMAIYIVTTFLACYLVYYIAYFINNSKNNKEKVSIFNLWVIDYDS